MAVVAGQIKQFKIGSVLFDPSGDWTISTSFTQRDHLETTYVGNNYFSEAAEPGKVSGTVKIKAGQDLTPLITADDSPVLILTPADIVYTGNMTYVGNAEHSVNEGDFQVELSGTLRRSLA